MMHHMSQLTCPSCHTRLSVSVKDSAPRTNAKSREWDATVRRFLDARAVQNPDSAVSAADMYRAYRAWEAEAPISKKAFGTALGNLGGKVRRTSTQRLYEGIELRG